jgi:hypothetical protein
MREFLGWIGWLIRQGALGGAMIGAGYGFLAPFLILALNLAGLVIWQFSYMIPPVAGCLFFVAGGVIGAGLGAVLALLAGGLGALATRLLGTCSHRLIQAGSIAVGALGTALVCVVLNLPGEYKPSWDSTGWSLLGWLLGLGVPVLAGAAWAWRASRRERTLALPR